MNSISFKRAKKVVAMHYGSYSFSSRKLCKFFNTDHCSDKSQAIRKEAERIIELRKTLGFEVTDAGIDAAWHIESQRQKQAHTGRWRRRTKKCVACKQDLKSNGWSVNAMILPACVGDCSLIAQFYFTPSGSKKSSCIGFKNMYGKSVNDLLPNESFDALLSYMVHLSAHRKMREIKNAELGNPEINAF